MSWQLLHFMFPSWPKDTEDQQLVTPGDHIFWFELNDWIGEMCAWYHHCFTVFIEMI